MKNKFVKGDPSMLEELCNWSSCKLDIAQGATQLENICREVIGWQVVRAKQQ